jgi:hypothetical protein
MRIIVKRESAGKMEMTSPQSTEVDKLLQSKIRVVNIGLREFARDMDSCKIPVIHVDWSPPAVTNPKIASLLAKLGG